MWCGETFSCMKQQLLVFCSAKYSTSWIVFIVFSAKFKLIWTIYASIVHHWIVNRWIVCCQIAQPYLHTADKTLLLSKYWHFQCKNSEVWYLHHFDFFWDAEEKVNILLNKLYTWLSECCTHSSNFDEDSCIPEVTHYFVFHLETIHKLLIFSHINYLGGASTMISQLHLWLMLNISIVLIITMLVYQSRRTLMIKSVPVYLILVVKVTSFLTIVFHYEADETFP